MQGWKSLEVVRVDVDGKPREGDMPCLPKDRATQARDAALIITGNWPALMAQCSHADLRPIRVRAGREATGRRKAG